MTNIAGTQDAPTRRPSQAEILAADELLTAIRSIKALPSRIVHDLELALERFLKDAFGSATDGEEVLDWLEEDDSHTVVDAVARIFEDV